MYRLNSKSRVILFDIDGVLADMEHRAHYLFNGIHGRYHIEDVDWEEFLSTCEKDRPLEAGLMILNMVIRNYFDHHKPRIIFVTARNAFARDMTLRWFTDVAKTNVKLLVEHQMCDLWMRPPEEDICSVDLKERWVDQIQKTGAEILFAFDDDPRIGNMYRRKGITCFVTNYREFNTDEVPEVSGERRKCSAAF